MTRIVKNRICYGDHNVVCHPAAATFDYMATMHDALTPNADARLHKAQLDSFGTAKDWSIEYPSVQLTNFWSSERAERNRELPTRILLTVQLHNGNYPKVIFCGHCARSDSFQALWNPLRAKHIHIPRRLQREAETEYFKRYDAAVAEHARVTSIHQQLQA